MRALEREAAQRKHADRVLKQHRHAGQHDEPAVADRPDNLWEPLPGDRGAHGVFGDEAKPRSVELELTKRRGVLAAGAAALVAAGALLAARD